MFTYELTAGGYNILENGIVIIKQPYNPETGQAYTSLEAQAVAEAKVNNLNPTSPTFQDVLNTQKVNIRNIGAKKLASIAYPYYQEEQSTWSIQLSEAEAYLLDSTAPTPMVDALTVNRGIDKAILVDMIMGNATLFRGASGFILGIQQKLLDRLDALPTTATLAEIEEIKWEF